MTDDITTALETVREWLTSDTDLWDNAAALAALSTIEAELTRLREANWANLGDSQRYLAERDEAALRARHCGCAWCCSTTPPEQRGEAHKRTCQPRLSTPKDETDE